MESNKGFFRCSFGVVFFDVFFNHHLQTLGGGFKYFLFSSLPGGMIQFRRAYFSNGFVQPPSRTSLRQLFLEEVGNDVWFFRVCLVPKKNTHSK